MSLEEFSQFVSGVEGRWVEGARPGVRAMLVQWWGVVVQWCWCGRVFYSYVCLLPLLLAAKGPKHAMGLSTLS